MKKYSLLGFAAYMIVLSSEGVCSVVNVKTNKPLAVKNGEVKLKCDSDTFAEDGSPINTKGTEYMYKIEDLKEWGEGSWEDVEAEPEVPVVEKTPEEILKEKNAAKLKELTAARKVANDELMANLTSPNMQEYGVKLKKAQDDLDAFKATLSGSTTVSIKEITPEEKESLVNLTDARLAVEIAQEGLRLAIEAHTAAGFKLPKKKGESTGSGAGVGGAERKLDYNGSQELRKRYAELVAEGKTHPEASAIVGEEFGVGRQAVHYKLTYRQHILKQGDPVYVPLSDEYYNRYQGEPMPCTVKEWYAKKA
jgi:hypothetical protein